jgi:hypothetical protein
MAQGDIEMMTDYLMRLYWLGVLLFPFRGFGFVLFI